MWDQSCQHVKCDTLCDTLVLGVLRAYKNYDEWFTFNHISKVHRVSCRDNFLSNASRGMISVIASCL